MGCRLGGSAEAEYLEPLGSELAQAGTSMRHLFSGSPVSCSQTVSPGISKHYCSNKDDKNDLRQWDASERLTTSERVAADLFDHKEQDGTSGNQQDAKERNVINMEKLGAQGRHMFVEKHLKHIENDNLRFLQKIRKRFGRVGIELPSVEVRSLCVEAECEVVHGKPLPTLWNTAKSMVSGFARLSCLKQRAKISIIKDVTGIIKPGRMTLLLGPPGCGKTTLLLALSGRLSHSLKLSGEISYNGYGLEEFVPQKTSAYVSQYDLHIPEMTVRETIDFSACCQGKGSREEIMMEVIRREKQAGIHPESDVDTYLKAISVEGLRSTLQTDYILKILGLDVCADTIVGDAMKRGISGGQKKRLTSASSRDL